MSFYISQTKLIILRISSGSVKNHECKFQRLHSLLPFRLDDPTNIMKNCEWLLFTWKNMQRVHEALREKHNMLTQKMNIIEQHQKLMICD